MNLRRDVDKMENELNWEKMEAKKGDKTEVMKVGQERHCCVEVGDRRLESMEVVKYFGVMISGDGRIEEKIRSRTGKTARVIGVLNEPVLK